jgi:hypothetical protein
MSHLDICSTSYDKKKGRKSGINLTSVRAGGVQHTVEKLSMKAISLFRTLFQSEV